MISIWSTNCDLISNLKAVKISGQLTAFLDTEFLILFVCRGRSNGKHTSRLHLVRRPLRTGQAYVQKACLRPVQLRRMFLHPVSPADICDHTNLRDQAYPVYIFMTSTFAHYFSPPMLFKSLITFTIFQDDGHFSTQRPHPTQEYIPLLLAGKYTSLCMKSLTESLQLAGTVVSVSHHGEIRVHAGIPAAVTLYTVSCVVILDVIALAGRAYEGTGSAAKQAS